MLWWCLVLAVFHSASDDAVVEDIGSSGSLMESGLPAPTSLTRQLSLARSTSAGAEESKDSEQGDGHSDTGTYEGSKGGPDAILGSVAVRSGGTGAMARAAMMVMYTGKSGVVDSFNSAGRVCVVVPNSVSGNTIGLYVLNAHTGLASVTMGVNVDNVRCVEALFGHPLTDIMVIRYVRQ